MCFSVSSDVAFMELSIDAKRCYVFYSCHIFTFSNILKNTFERVYYKNASKNVTQSSILVIY